MFTFEDTSSHLRLTFSGEVNDWQICQAIRTITTHQDYRHKNDLWHFDRCTSRLTHDVFTRLIDTILDGQPESAGRRKTALVTESGFHNAIAELFVEYATQLPQIIRVFTGLDEAESWIADSRRSPA